MTRKTTTVAFVKDQLSVNTTPVVIPIPFTAPRVKYDVYFLLSIPAFLT